MVNITIQVKNMTKNKSKPTYCTLYFNLEKSEITHMLKVQRQNCSPIIVVSLLALNLGVLQGFAFGHSLELFSW